MLVVFCQPLNRRYGLDFGSSDTGTDLMADIFRCHRNNLHLLLMSFYFPSLSVISPTSRLQKSVPPYFSVLQTPNDERSVFFRICRGESTCHMIEQVPPNMSTLSVRKCMCDAECSKYGDCCLDSPYYNETEQRINYKQFHCLSTFPFSVRMSNTNKIWVIIFCILQNIGNYLDRYR